MRAGGVVTALIVTLIGLVTVAAFVAVSATRRAVENDEAALRARQFAGRWPKDGAA